MNKKLKPDINKTKISTIGIWYFSKVAILTIATLLMYATNA